MFKRSIIYIITICFVFNNFQYAGAVEFNVNQLPVPGKMVELSTALSPISLKGLIINPQKPLEFEFLVDTGDSHPEQSEGSKRDSSAPTSMAHQNEAMKDKAFEKESNRLIKYFLAGLTIPEGDLWVNLSPYEKDRITTPSLGETELGRDLLAQDYILKQLTASLIYPEKDLGREFWNKVYKQAQSKFGTTNIPINTFNKVWILPNEAQVFESQKGAYVTKATLKVMLAEDYEASAKSRQNKNFGGLEEDYVAIQKNSVILSAAKDLKRDSSSLKSVPQNDTCVTESQIIRDIVLPAITKEVNEGKNFAPLRQIYHSLILAKWYKETVANGLLDAVYTNKGKIKGVNLNDPSIKQQIYNRYLQAYKKGVFNYIKEESILSSMPVRQAGPNVSIGDLGHDKTSRKYFSGGLVWNMVLQRDGAMSAVKIDGDMASVKVRVDPEEARRGGMDLVTHIDALDINGMRSQQNREVKQLTLEEIDESSFYMDEPISITYQTPDGKINFRRGRFLKIEGEIFTIKTSNWEESFGLKDFYDGKQIIAVKFISAFVNNGRKSEILRTEWLRDRDIYMAYTKIRSQYKAMGASGLELSMPLNEYFKQKKSSLDARIFAEKGLITIKDFVEYSYKDLLNMFGQSLEVIDLVHVLAKEGLFIKSDNYTPIKDGDSITKLTWVDMYRAIDFLYSKTKIKTFGELKKLTLKQLVNTKGVKEGLIKSIIIALGVEGVQLTGLTDDVPSPSSRQGVDLAMNININSVEQFRYLIKKAQEIDQLDEKLDKVFAPKGALNRWIDLLENLYNERTLYLTQLIGKVKELGNIEAKTVGKDQLRIFQDDPEVEQYLIKKGLLRSVKEYLGEISLELFVVLHSVIKTYDQMINFKDAQEFLFKKERPEHLRNQLWLIEIYPYWNMKEPKDKRYLLLNDLKESIKEILKNDLHMKDNNLIEAILKELEKKTKTVVLGDKIYYELQKLTLDLTDKEIKELVQSMKEELKRYDVKNIAEGIIENVNKKVVIDTPNENSWDDLIDTQEKCVALIINQLTLKLTSGYQVFLTDDLMDAIKIKSEEVYKQLEIKDGQVILRKEDLAMKVGLDKTIPSGGIDLNQMGINRFAHVINVDVDLSELKSLQMIGIEGFKPVILDIRLIDNVSSLFN